MGTKRNRRVERIEKWPEKKCKELLAGRLKA
jgi:hypothetical protein